MVVIAKAAKFFGCFEFGVFFEDKQEVWIRPGVLKLCDFLKAKNFEGAHIFFRPVAELEPLFMLVDDLDLSQVERFHMQGGAYRSGRMVVETSPGNFQVWIRSTRAIPNEEKSIWLQKLENDPGAAPFRRWGRAPGFRNRKEKHRTDSGFPLARLIWCDWNSHAVIPRIQVPLIEVAPKIFTPNVSSSGKSSCIRRENNGGRGESEKDFRFSMALIRSGLSDSAVCDRIRSERTNWKNHLGREQVYCERTVRNARARIENG